MPTRPSDWLAPVDLAQALWVMGPQYGSNQLLGLEDLSLPNLSLTDQMYLAKMGDLMFPGDTSAAANWQNWLSTMQTMHPEMLQGTPWAPQTTTPTPATPNPVTDPTKPWPYPQGPYTPPGVQGDWSQPQYQPEPVAPDTGSAAYKMGRAGTFAEGLKQLADSVRPQWDASPILNSPLAAYLKGRKAQ